MAGKSSTDIEIISPDQGNTLGVAAALPGGQTGSNVSPRKQKIRASEVVIIILLILLVLCCCCVCLGSAAIVKAIALALGGAFFVPPVVF
jgi:hypothetical protein